jgi:hypothetical protein
MGPESDLTHRGQLCRRKPWHSGTELQKLQLQEVNYALSIILLVNLKELADILFGIDHITHLREIVKSAKAHLSLIEDLHVVFSESRQVSDVNHHVTSQCWRHHFNEIQSTQSNEKITTYISEQVFGNKCLRHDKLFLTPSGISDYN